MAVVVSSLRSGRAAVIPGEVDSILALLRNGSVLCTQDRTLLKFDQGQEWMVTEFEEEDDDG